ncbi:MAG: restriction endonuclease subunit S [Kiritimatiellae bacterium]|nr:restriction endonuclease subunit S [Kiritimatiellia bacterium]
MAVWSVVNTSEMSKYRRIDGEFFHPNYLVAEDLVLRSENVKALGHLGDFIIGPFGSAFHVNNYDKTSVFRYVRGKDVKPFALLNDDNVYMPEKDYQRLAKYAIQEDDLLISVVGTLGNVAIVPGDIEGIFSCKSTVFRNSKVDPYYLLAYFNSLYGKTCLLRRQRGAIQTGLNKEDLKTVPVPLLTELEQSIIGKSIKKALELSRRSQSLYAQAQELLERELGLDKLVFNKPLSYESSLSEVVGNNRADAECYQPMYQKLRTIIRNYKHGFSKLTDIVFSLPPNINPRNFANNEFEYVELSCINPSLGIIGKGTRLLGKEAPSRARRKLETGDILASAVVGSVDKAAIVDALSNGKLASTGFFQFRPKQIKSEYLLILVRSKFTTMQLQQEATGGILSAVPDNRLHNVIIPTLPNALQVEISSLVSKSHNYFHESQLLLEQAKRRVEELIEQAVQG